jgi:type I restriction enzyme R subunit
LDLDAGNGGDNNITLKERLKEGRKKLDAAREALKYLCDQVAQPREVEQYIHYFCGDGKDHESLSKTEALRISFYKSVATFVRAYTAIALELEDAGYTKKEVAALNQEAEFFADTRSAIKKYSGEELDIKPYEADMRHLINTYIQASPADPLGKLDDYSLVELIIETGIHDAIAKKLNEKGKLSNNAVAEGIINNVRKTIIREQLTDPKFYEKMSKLLDDLIKQARADAASYEKFLQQAEALVRKIATKGRDESIPESLKGRAEAIVLFNNLEDLPAETFVCPQDETEKARLVLEIDRAMRVDAPASWKGDPAREAQVLNALYSLMGKDRTATQALFELIKNQPGYQ